MKKARSGKFFPAIFAAVISISIPAAPVFAGDAIIHQVQQQAQGPSAVQTVDYLNGRCFIDPITLMDSGRISYEIGLSDRIIDLQFVDVGSIFIETKKYANSKYYSRVMFVGCTNSKCHKRKKEGDKYLYYAKFNKRLRKSLNFVNAQDEKCINALKHLSILYGAEEKELF